MPLLQIRTTHNNTLVQLHQHKQTTKGHGFVDGSRAGGEVISHITILNYRTNSLQANPDKYKSYCISPTEQRGQTIAEKWNSDMENTAYSKVTQDRTLSYKETYIQKIKMKVAPHGTTSRGNSKWEKNAGTIRTTALALCYSVTKYATSVWSRSKYAHLLYPELNQTCRAITGYMKPTNVEDL